MRRLALVVVFVALLWMVGSALATPRAPIVVQAKAISSVTVVSDTALQVTTSTDWSDLSGATASVRIPGNWTTGLILARFSAMGGVTNGGYGEVQILIGGVEGNPAGGTGFRFAQASDGAEMEAHSMDRSLALGPGTYAVQVQFALGPFTNTELDLSDWSLTVELARAA